MILKVRIVLFLTFNSKTTEGPKYFKAVFIVLWPHLLTTKLRCLLKNNFGHTNQADVTRKAHPLKAVMTALFENFFLAASYALFVVQGFTLCTVYQFWKFYSNF